MTDATLAVQANDPTFENIFDELEWRGYIHVSTDPDELRSALANGPITYYCGFDPTAPSLHLGHLVQLLMLRRLQLAGHKPLGLVGGSTGLVGDPRPTAERQLHSRDVVAEWVERLRGQIGKYLSFEGENAARMVNNLDWTAPLSAIDFLRDIGKHFRVGAMLKKDAVAARLNSDAGISYTEFSYQVLQAIDYLELHRQYDCVLQTGGSDQWGNLTGGVDLIRRVEGAKVHALGSPLITNSDGTKFGKSEGNAIWIDGDLTSPYAFYQFWLNTDDADVIARIKVFTFFNRDQIAEFERLVADEPFRRAAQRALAREVTQLVHGAVATDAAVAASEALFGQGDLGSLDATTLGAAVAELPNADVSIGTSVAQALVDTTLASSLGEARRFIGQGGVSLNKVKVDDESAVIADAHLLPGGYVIVRRGKKNLAGLAVQAPA
ncbi:MAG: tyrosine--tRNA ligase [Pseudoclavibacter sp.]